MLSFLVYLPVRGVALPVLLGLGRPRAAAIGLLVMGICNLVLSLLLVKTYGILGVAVGTAIPNVLFALFVAVTACRELGVRPGEYARYVAGRAVVGALVPFGALVAFRATVGFNGLPQLVAGGFLLVAIFAATWFLFVYRNDHLVPLPLGLTGRSRSASRPGPGNTP
jgi:O-antigen/teichoic acid export membrane protein